MPMAQKGQDGREDDIVGLEKREVIWNSSAVVRRLGASHCGIRRCSEPRQG